MLSENKPKSPLSYVYITSPSRSGSTLLAFLLATHPEICSVGEFPTYIKGRPRCSCLEPFDQCPFWNKVEQELNQEGKSYFEHNIDFDRRITSFSKKIIHYPMAEPYETIRNRTARFFSSHWKQEKLRLEYAINVSKVAARVAEANIFVDASKSFYLMRLFAREKERPDVSFKFIHLVRDPRGVVASIIRTNQNLKISKVAASWNNFNNRVELLANQHLEKDQVLMVNYNQLCENPGQWMSIISQFLGIENSFQLENIDHKLYHIHGNAMRKRKIEKINEDIRWKSELSDDQVKQINQITGKLAAKYGFEF